MNSLTRIALNYGIKNVPQLIILEELSKVESAGPSSFSETAKISSAGCTQAVDALEKKGLVERFDDPKDRRGKKVRLTHKGTKAVAEMKAADRFGS